MLSSTGWDQYYGEGLSKISNKVVSLPFTDVASDNYFYDGVYSGYGRGYMTGKSSTVFAPTENMQRQDVAVVLYRLAGTPSISYSQIYPDVSSTAYYAKATAWAHDNNIVTGYANGYFGVGENITREAFAVTLCRYANYRGMNTSSSVALNTYTDGYLVSEFATDAVKWAVEQELMGKGVLELRPQDNISRADISVMIYRFLSL